MSASSGETGAPIPCPGCGALTPDVDGPLHPYLGASAGCRAVYGEVLAKEYGEYRYPAVHRLPLDEAGRLALAVTLKQRCGTGGTVKDGVIEIQGDQRDRLAAVPESMGYWVKRVGG